MVLISSLIFHSLGPRELCIKGIQNFTLLLSDKTKKKCAKTSSKFKAISDACRDARIAYSFPKIVKSTVNIKNIVKMYKTLTPYAATMAKFDIGAASSQILFLLYQNSSLLARLGVMNKKKAS